MMAKFSSNAEPVVCSASCTSVIPTESSAARVVVTVSGLSVPGPMLWIAAYHVSSGPRVTSPPGPDETWYAAIQSIGPGADSPLTVTTTLAADDSVGMALVQLALQTTGSALLENFAIIHSGGFGSTGYAPPGEPGVWGYYYLP